MPALFTRMSITGKLGADPFDHSGAARRGRRSRRSSRRSSRPAARTSRSTSLPSGSREALTPTMSAPASASARAIARPIPRRHPVTRAARPSSRKRFSTSSSSVSSHHASGKPMVRKGQNVATSSTTSIASRNGSRGRATSPIFIREMLQATNSAIPTGGVH